MQPLVTVIIPTYNCEAYITQTIDSVLAQDYPSIELIIIDDGSTDTTCQIIEGYGDKIQLLIKQSNSGVCSARNRGIKEANGEYICLLDHDDYWFPNKISMQMAAFQQSSEVGIVYSAFALWHPSNDGNFPAPYEICNDQISNYDNDETYSGWIFHQLLLDCWVLTSTAMIRTEVFENCGVFDESLPYSEDWDLWLRVAEQYQFLKLCPITTLYRQHLEQGNKKLRSIDYRSTLLIKYKKRIGLCSQDGRCISKWQFQRQLAEYRAAFGLHHLYYEGDFKLALLSFFQAWLCFPVKLKYLAYLFAASAGWKPKW